MNSKVLMIVALFAVASVSAQKAGFDPSLTVDAGYSKPVATTPEVAFYKKTSVIAAGVAVVAAVAAVVAATAQSNNEVEVTLSA